MPGAVIGVTYTAVNKADMLCVRDDGIEGVGYEATSLASSLRVQRRGKKGMEHRGGWVRDDRGQHACVAPLTSMQKEKKAFAESMQRKEMLEDGRERGRVENSPQGK